LQVIRSSLLRLHTLRLEAAMKLAIGDFRITALCFYIKQNRFILFYIKNINCCQDK